jgi:hypothetical protein
MKLSELNNLLALNISISDFTKNINSEISDYKRNINKKGTSSPVLLQEDMDRLLITKSHVKFLCNAYLNNKMDEWELSYLAEAMLLSEKIDFDDEKTSEALYTLTDSEYFKLINGKYIEKVIKELGS